MKIEIKENEIYLDDVKYVKAVPTQNFENNKKIGDVMKFSNLDWCIIDEDDETRTLFSKKTLSDEMIKKHFTQKSMIDSDGDVKYSFGDNSWKNSYIRLVLNTSFINELDQDRLVKMNDDFVRLIEKDECEKLPVEIRKNKAQKNYWTMTPYNTTYAGVFYFVSTGLAGGAYSSRSFRVVGLGVRPVIKVKK